MSILKDTWRFLVGRRLWPVAVLLVAAAAAVPMLLSQDPPPPAVGPTAAVKGEKGKEDVLAENAIVTKASDGDRSGRRRVLGSTKDPFKPKATPTPTPTAAPIKPAATPAGTGPAGGSATTTPGSGSAPTTGASPAPDAGVPVLPKKKKKYELAELTIRFGSSADTTRPARRDVKRLQALPSNGNPVLIYMGLMDDNKTAVFLLDSGVVAQGDGTCRPTRNQCETVHIREGETEFFDVATAGTDGTEGTDSPDPSGGAQYQLDVIKIRKTSTTDAKKANKARASVSKKGRMIVRARIAGDGPLRYRYDKKTGKLHKLSHKAYKAVVANAARAARAHF